MFEYFLDLQNVPGDSVTPGFEGQIELCGWKWDQESDSSRESSPDADSASKVRDFKFFKWADKATPKLMLACLSKQGLPKAVMTCRTKGDQSHSDFLKVTLLGLRVSAYRIESTGEFSERPTEELSIAFGQILFEWTERRANGSFSSVVRCGWDVLLDKSF